MMRKTFSASINANGGTYTSDTIVNIAGDDTNTDSITNSANVTLTVKGNEKTLMMVIQLQVVQELIH